jgi:hypothetical protein
MMKGKKKHQNMLNLAHDFHAVYLITSYKKSFLCMVSGRNPVLFMGVIPNTVSKNQTSGHSVYYLTH